MNKIIKISFWLRETVCDFNEHTGSKLITVQDNNLIQGDFKKAGRFYSPLVKSISQKEKISITELEQITGTG